MSVNKKKKNFESATDDDASNMCLLRTLAGCKTELVNFTVIFSSLDHQHVLRDHQESIAVLLRDIPMAVV